MAVVESFRFRELHAALCLALIHIVGRIVGFPKLAFLCIATKARNRL